MEKIYFTLGVIFVALFSACAAISKANDCTGIVPVPNKDWALLSEVYDKRVESEKSSADLVDSRDVPPPKYVDPATVISTKDYKHYKDKNAVYLYGRKIPEACPNSFEVFSRQYAKDAHHVFYGERKIEGADSKSFVYLGYARKEFAKDKNFVYSNGQKVPFLDAPSFEVIDDFVKDKNHVYISTPPSEKISIIEGADPKTFKSLGHGYAKDDHMVYKLWRKVDGADAKTFQIIDDTLEYPGHFTKDKNAVYRDEHKLDNVDVQSFQVSPGPAEPVIKDKNHVYCRSGEASLSIVKEADPATFRGINKGHYYYTDDKNIFGDCTKIDGVDAQTFEVLSGFPPDHIRVSYVKDKHAVYMIKNAQAEILPADPKTFMIIKETGHNVYTRDKNKVFFDSALEYKHVPLADADPDTFQMIDQNMFYSKDKNFVYYNGEKIDGAEAATFQVLNYYLSKDKKNVYNRTQKIEGLDAASTKILQSSSLYNIYILDNTSVYYVELGQLRKIEGVNPKTFQVEKDFNGVCATDGKNYYNSGKKVDSCPM
jgi:hypothetical protein